MTRPLAAPLSDVAAGPVSALMFGAPFVLTPTELRTDRRSIRLIDVRHVGLLDRKDRQPTRRLVQLAAAVFGTALGGLAWWLTRDTETAGVLALVVLLAGVLGSDAAEARFPTPGRYGLVITTPDGDVVLDGMRSEEAAQLVHERVAAAVRAAQGLNG